MKKVIIISLLFLSFNTKAQTLSNFDLDSVFDTMEYRELNPSELITIFKSEVLVKDIVYCESEFLLAGDLAIGITYLKNFFLVYNSLVPVKYYDMWIEKSSINNREKFQIQMLFYNISTRKRLSKSYE